MIVITENIIGEIFGTVNHIINHICDCVTGIIQYGIIVSCGSSAGSGYSVIVRAAVVRSAIVVSGIAAVSVSGTAAVGS